MVHIHTHSQYSSGPHFYTELFPKEEEWQKKKKISYSAGDIPIDNPSIPPTPRHDITHLHNQHHRKIYLFYIHMELWMHPNNQPIFGIQNIIGIYLAYYGNK